MPVNPTYPGLYIEELPSSTHTITAAPTSVTVFIGYPHPFQTPTANFGQPIELFSFTDYETNFGGFFQSDMFTADEQAGFFSDLANAVNQFFLNGGGIAWVIGLQSEVFVPGATFKVRTPGGGTLSVSPTSVAIGSLNYVGGEVLTLGPLTFTAREFTDSSHVITIKLSVPQSGIPASASQPDTIVDLLITYGPPSNVQGSNSTVATESYRQVSLYTPTIAGQPNPNYIANRINGVSALVTVATPVPVSGVVAQGIVSSIGWFSTASPPPLPTKPPTFPISAAKALIFSSGDFIKVLQADTPLDKLSIFNLMVLPGVSDFATLEAAVSFCERKLAFLIMDPPPGDSADGTIPPGSTLIQDDFNGAGPNTIPQSQNAGLYFPYLQSPDPLTGKTIAIPPSATIAGIFASTDSSRGVWKAPAGLATTLTNIIDVMPSGKMTDMRQGVLNQLGINCIRKFPSIAPVVWGARTTVAANPAFAQWKYVPVRRMALFLEQTLYINLGWVVFEPNAEPLWTSIVSSIQAFMLGLYRQGAFQGTTPSQAFQVKCDSSTTTQDDIDNGIVNIVVAFAPLKPAEFVIIQIAQLAGQTQTS